MIRKSVLCTLALVACGSGGEDSGTGQVWNDSASQRHASLAESLSNRSAPVIFIGDSLVQGWTSEGIAEWMGLFQPLGAMNLGVSGERTSTLIEWVNQWEPGPSVPKTIFLHIGTNDSNTGTVPAPTIAAGIIEAARALQRTLDPEYLIVSSIFPRDRNLSARRSLLEQANQIVRSQAGHEGFIFIDSGRQFLDMDGRIPESIMPDALHLSALGYELWADDLRALLDSLTAGTARAPVGQDH